MFDMFTVLTVVALVALPWPPVPPESVEPGRDTAKRFVQGTCDNDGECDDGDPCTEDNCVAGQCLNSSMDCSELDDQCNYGLCLDGECLAVPTPGAPCDDADACTEGDQCDEDGECTVNTPVVCNSGYVCNPATGSCELVLTDLDIMPGRCPNVLRRRGRGAFRVVLLGHNDLRAEEVDTASLRLCRESGDTDCVAPMVGHRRVRDRVTPLKGPHCPCHTLRKDGLNDVDLKFKLSEVVSVLQLDSLPTGAEVVLGIFGYKHNGLPIIAWDCVVLED